MIVDSIESNAIRVLKPLGKRMTSRAVHVLDAMIGAEAERGTPALLIDLSGVRNLPASGLAALVELSRRWHCPAGRLSGGLVFGICGLSGEDAARLRQCGIAGRLPLYPSRSAALAAPEFRRHALARTRAVLMCGDPGPSLAPLTLDRCPALLDIAGRPLIDRILDSLAVLGLREAIVTTGHHAPPLLDRLRNRNGQALFPIAEGHWRDDRWIGQPMGPIRSLRMLHECHGALRGDTLVIESNGFFPLSHDRLMEHHRATKADLTVATARSRAPSTQVGAPGAWVVSPRCLDALREIGPAATLTDLLAILPATGLRVERYDHRGDAFALSDPGAYFDLLSAALSGKVAGLTPTGERVAERIWIEEGARLAKGLKLEGALHVGANAELCEGARLGGTNAIGAGARVESRTLVRNSVIWPETRVGNGAIVDSMIASGAWAVNHRFTSATTSSRAPLDGVTPISAPSSPPRPLKLARTARIA